MGMTLLRVGCCLFLTALFATAQTPTPTPTNNLASRPYWTAELPGGKFKVALDAVSSISQSEYIVDNAVRVTEVSIGTTGSVQGRFYYLEPFTPQSPLASGQDKIELLKSKVNEVLDRVSEDNPDEMVLKNYLASTHAHTVEFRLRSKAVLAKLYDSLDSALKNLRDTRFKP